MLKKLILPLLVLASLTAQAQTKKSGKKSKKGAATTQTAPQNLTDSLSYAMGLSAGQFLKSMGAENLNYDMLNKAIAQTLKGDPTLFDISTAQGIMERFVQTSMQKKAVAEKEKAKQFLEQNKKKAGVTETASGLQYEVLKEGNGPKPGPNDQVVVHYAGKLLNGEEFDSSYERGEPVTLGVSGVIPGWTEALQLMPVGSKWRLYIPSELAYGEQGAGRDIPGGATLIFDVELLEITGKK
ncbi:FKBP-type peptidyl-prolyl cis-trans isomerase [Botryobacter ruber]|uniref:FKBP-type peptidyl-prolyl cis-trans isomerase n=1 Tax=Botryobacter ruber TaxID=2171629 RepID=UPI000E0B73E8|nr:FKBP-type peptidyl-prolyl cis-trans isomerase [Botryobacter ruber]